MEIVILAIAYPAAITLLFYFIFLRPVQQQDRRRRQALTQLQVGDSVLTQAGFIATVKDIIIPESGGATEILLDLGSGVEVRALASAILQRWSQGQPSGGLAEAEAGRRKG